MTWRNAWVLVLFFCVQYPLIQTMTRLMGRAWMFRWRNQLNHRRGPYWRTR